MKCFTVALAKDLKLVELHATGCRDLVHLKKAKRTVDADSYAQVVRPARTAGIRMVAYPCCSPTRMAAAGR